MASKPTAEFMDVGSSVRKIDSRGGVQEDINDSHTDRSLQALHIQVVRIKKEDENLGEDQYRREGLSPRERLAIFDLMNSDAMKDVFLSNSRPVFRSPLGVKPEQASGPTPSGIRASR
uniref:Uncharacterized protein n=1 Tax=Picea sitchensis TaxID=3332 RepID=A9NQ20_PICSI|nr:unknown [Picea sitchensis]